jgi:hypothetical protein
MLTYLAHNRPSTIVVIRFVRCRADEDSQHFSSSAIPFSACIKSEGGDSLMRGYFTSYPEEVEQAKAFHDEVRKDPKRWGGGTVGDIPWEIGETVKIKMKAAPATMRIVDNSESWSYDASQAVWIDLGNSQIIELIK